MNMLRSSSLSSPSLQSLIPRQPNILNPTRNFFSHTRSPLPLNLKHSSSTSNLILRTVCSSTSDNGSHHPSSQGGDFFFRGVLAKMEAVYLSRNPTAKSVLDLVGSNEQISYDHFAFRTFGDIIHKYTENSGSGKKYAALASAVGTLTWEKPLYTEFQQLARESEYAAWTLVNGYAVNHVTISAHQLKSELKDIKSLNQFIEKNGFKLNSEGGILKVSPDGLLLQSSTVADPVQFQFRDGQTELVPCSYIEFAQRLVLPQYSNLSSNEVKEHHRRDGFEVGNADKIFESTSNEQLTRRAA